MHGKHGVHAAPMTLMLVSQCRLWDLCQAVRSVQVSPMLLFVLSTIRGWWLMELIGLWF